jgi:tRNA A-37 threonylcarbamoyl transferase component Bud32
VRIEQIEKERNLLTQKKETTKVFCHTRGVKMPIGPHRWLEILEEVLRSPEKIVKEDSEKRTVKVALAPWGHVCVTEVEWSMAKMLASPLKPFRRRFYWNNLLDLHKREVPVVEPLLYLEVKEGGFVVRSYLVTRWIDGQNLGRMATERLPSTEEELKKLVKQATYMVSHFHNLGFVHGHLNWSDILIDRSRPSAIVLAGLDEVKRSTSYSLHGKDLAQFVLSAYAYGFEREFADRIVSWYFWAAGYRPEAFDRGLIRQLAKYELAYKGLSKSRFYELIDR